MSPAEERLEEAVRLAAAARHFADKGKDNAALSYLAGAVEQLARGLIDARVVHTGGGS